MMNHTRRVEVSELQRALAAAGEALTAEQAARRDESAAAAAEIAQLTERLTAAEATRHSDMSDISWPDISESRMREDVQPDLERGETPSPLVRGAGRWTEELTGNAASLTNLGESGADLVWGKPMPNFTNGEMQNELAPRLAESLARAQLHEGCY